jgi:hypothetical protein
MTIMLKGRALGGDGITALENINLIQGRTAMSAQLIVGLCKRHEDCEYFSCIERTNKSATWVTKRRGSPHEIKSTFTIEDAEKMKLVNKDNWTKQPGTMLMWRAATALARMEYSDIAMGLYDPEEIQ